MRKSKACLFGGVPCVFLGGNGKRLLIVADMQEDFVRGALGSAVQIEIVE